jgi:poly(3-hydroxybutyrate) depolymerase
MTSTHPGLMELALGGRRVEGRIRREMLAVAVLVLALLLVPGAPCVAGAVARSGPTGTSSAASDPDAASTAPIVSHVRVSSWTFEGHQVYSYVPTHPVGIVFLFHGSNGGADFARKLESVDLLNELTDRGYGFVATDSTERTGRKQWDIVHTTAQTNPDLARIDRLRQRVIDTTPVTPATPIYGIGMSNGSAFVCLWATASTAAGHAVSAVGMYMDGVPGSVRTRGGMKVPTFMVVGQHDTVTNPTKERRDLERIKGTSVPTEFHEVVGQPLSAQRYLRIPGVTLSEGDAIVAGFTRAGFDNDKGAVDVAMLDQLESGSQAVRVALARSLPAGLSGSQKLAVKEETLATVGAHQFNAEFKIQNALFFATHR